MHYRIRRNGHGSLMHLPDSGAARQILGFVTTRKTLLMKNGGDNGPPNESGEIHTSAPDLVGSRSQRASTPPCLDRLPLASVRTFAAVARLLSITRAAEELNVTPSAVSHQIKILETYLETALFRREKNRLHLTADGEQYVAQVFEALSVLGDATKSLKAPRRQQTLRIGSTASLALLWLIPRLERFTHAYRDVALTVTGSRSRPQRRRTLSMCCCGTAAAQRRLARRSRSGTIMSFRSATHHSWKGSSVWRRPGTSRATPSSSRATNLSIGLQRPARRVGLSGYTRRP